MHMPIFTKYLIFVITFAHFADLSASKQEISFAYPSPLLRTIRFTHFNSLHFLRLT